MKRILFTFYTLFICIPLFAQTITGKVYNADTKEPLAFANFIINKYTRKINNK